MCICCALSGINALILESKQKREVVFRTKKVDAISQNIAWAFIVLLNMGMLFFVFLFAVSQSTERQAAWIQTFIVWLVLKSKRLS